MASLNGNLENRSPIAVTQSSDINLTEFSGNNLNTSTETQTNISNGNVKIIKDRYIADGTKSPSVSVTKSSTMESAGGDTASSPRRAYVTVAILFFINLLNYMDRYTIAGVLTAVRKDFGMNDAESGLLQTVFVCAYMVFAPIFGFLGDRYSRKWIMIVGIFVWSTSVLLSTFVPAHLFPVFLFCRGVVGIGEASYSTVSSTLIADLFTKDMRSRMLMIFYFAIPVGSGLGFVIGSSVAGFFDDPNTGWRWGVRVTPVFGLVCLFLLIFVLQEPKRGQSEQVTRLQTSSWFSDLFYLVKNRSFVWTTLGFTCVTFAAGSLSWWGPTFVAYAVQTQMKTIGLIFGMLTTVGGFVGVSVGSMSAQFWRRSNPKADPLVCGIGVLLCVPFLYSSLTFILHSEAVSWVSIFMAVTCLSLNWAIVSDILLSTYITFMAKSELLRASDLRLYVIPPNRRATASAFQILFSHLLGDASSPYMIGVVSDAIRAGSESYASHFYALQYAMYIPDFVLVMGGFFFLGTAWFVQADRQAAELLSKGVTSNSPSPSDTVTNYGGVSDVVVSEMPTADSRVQLISPDDDPADDAVARYRL